LICISASPCYLDDGAYTGGFTQADLDVIYNAMAEDYRGWVVGFALLMMRNAERPQLTQAFFRSLLALAPPIARSVARAIFQSDYRAMLPEVPIPTLLLQSPDDPEVPLAVGRYMKQALPHATLREIESYGHFPQMSAPEVVNAAIRAYLAS
jgi:sigma-B regulation protein RsbQ